jgi:YesN/AraC family two-component response regulator
MIFSSSKLLCPLSIHSAVGYNDALYFGQVFKREVGMPPSKYRIEQHTSEE